MKLRTVSRTDGDGQYLGNREIVELTATNLQVVREVRQSIAPFLENAPTSFVLDRLGDMYVSMARRAEQDSDKKALLKVYAIDLNEYPADIVADACMAIRREQKFFPTISEVRAECDVRFAFRRSIAAELDVLLSGRRPLMTPPDPRKSMGYKELPRDKWLQEHWDRYIADAEGMVALSANNAMVDKAGWEAEVAKRKAALPAAFVGVEAPPESPATPTAEKEEGLSTPL